MELLANWTGLIAVGCTLAMAALSAVAYLDANRRTRGIRTSSELEADIGRMIGERNALGEEVARLRVDRDALVDVEQKKTALQNEIALLETQVALARDCVAQEAETIKKAEELDQKIADRLTRYGEAEQELVKVRDQVAAKEIELKQVVADLEEKVKLRDIITPEIADLTTRRDFLRQEAGTARAEMEEISRTRQQEETRTAEARLRRDALIEETGRLERRLSELNDALERAQANRGTVAELEVAARKLEMARKESANLDARMAAIQAEVTALNAQRVNALARSTGEAGDEHDKVALGGLTNVPELFLRAKHPLAIVDEDEALRSVKETIRQRGLIFSDRVVNAFHTSLKISSISPLTVLAGISGTGKSELPRQYAIGMGLPFLQLAVQPRWDSPQDLFGFYNYMEKKYKPTELVRLMVQLDTRNWPEEARRYKDHMALVLLDEMNLARVEYYFSEFLSRLEVRRGSETEAAAEIELDLGRSSPKKIYPVPRLLFVGTMNEDESTQTLSDKVVDRANVLRFPRPKALQSGTASGTDVEGIDRFLPFSVWRSWCRTVDARSGSRVDVWLKRLNDAMEQAGRPFGHRMAQAIAAYVANYPKSVNDAEAVAMADQLEMRLFPKLRGVDPKADDRIQRALEDLRLFIEDEIKDPKLVEAFDEGKDGDLFAWRGVDRG
jgi:AAA domain (dynein-related subfamily)